MLNTLQIYWERKGLSLSLRLFIFTKKLWPSKGKGKPWTSKLHNMWKRWSTGTLLELIWKHIPWLRRERLPLESETETFPLFCCSRWCSGRWCTETKPSTPSPLSTSRSCPCPQPPAQRRSNTFTRWLPSHKHWICFTFSTRDVRKQLLTPVWATGLISLRSASPHQVEQVSLYISDW